VKPEIMFYYEDSEYEDEEDEEDEDSGDEKKSSEVGDGDIDDPLLSFMETLYMTHNVDRVPNGNFDPEGSSYLKQLAGRYDVIWARKRSQWTQCLTAVGHSGNDASLLPYYGNACIVTSWKVVVPGFISSEEGVE
jgi:hypothetical protein